MSFLKSGNTFRVTSKEELNLHDTLPVGTYVVKFNSMQGCFYLERIDDFTLPSKLYGDTNRHAERILNTFLDRPAGTGVILNGEKGSGKTLLSKKIAVQAAAQGISTILVNTPHFGDTFNNFLQDIEVPVVVLFDEFEKVYDDSAQEAVLTLLDGVFPSQKLYVITCNDKYRIDSHMRNRPGRIYYMLDFTGLDADFIREYCVDCLLNQSHTDTVCKIATLFSQFNFDMLKAMVEEMNRYGESPQQVMQMLNTKPEFSDNLVFNVNLESAEPDCDPTTISKSWKGNPMTSPIEMEYRGKEDIADRGFEWYTAEFCSDDIQIINPSLGQFVFKNGDGDKLTLTRTKPKVNNWLKML